MSIVYSSDLATVICADARDVLGSPGVDRRTVGLLLTDPPYGMEWRSARRAQQFDMLANDDADESARDGISEVLALAVRRIRDAEDVAERAARA